MLVNQDRTLRLLKQYKIRIPKTIIINKSEIKKLRLKFPVALKVDSPKVIHKSDMGLVTTNILSLNELNRHLKTMHTILKMHNISNYSFVVQEMIKGQELIMGMKRDPTFGPVIIFGFGGVLVEILKDVSMRIAPLTKEDCIEMIDELKSKKLLEGYRNIPKVNKNKIIEVLLKFSRMSLNQKHLKEIDFNPVIVNKKEAIVVDARLIESRGS